MGVSRAFVLDAAERVGFSVLLAAVSTVLIVLGDVDASWVPLVVAVLTSVKVLVASQVGDPDSGGLIDTREIG